MTSGKNDSAGGIFELWPLRARLDRLSKTLDSRVALLVCVVLFGTAEPLRTDQLLRGINFLLVFLFLGLLLGTERRRLFRSPGLKLGRIP